MTPPSHQPDDRAEAARVHQEALERARQAQAAEAGVMLARFVEAAERAGIVPVPLRALGYGGRRWYRTGLTGWYLRRNCTVAVGEDTKYYVLKVPDSLAGRFTSVQLSPQPPPLVVGAGGRDGEAIDLADLLANRLAGANDWPRP